MILNGIQWYTNGYFLRVNTCETRIIITLVYFVALDTSLLTSSNEIGHEQCGQLPVMLYNFALFQPYAASLTCSVEDANGPLYWDSHQLCIVFKLNGGMRCSHGRWSNDWLSQLLIIRIGSAHFHGL